MMMLLDEETRYYIRLYQQGEDENNASEFYCKDSYRFWSGIVTNCTP